LLCHMCNLTTLVAKLVLYPTLSIPIDKYLFIDSFSSY